MNKISLLITDLVNIEHVGYSSEVGGIGRNCNYGFTSDIERLENVILNRGEFTIIKRLKFLNYEVIKFKQARAN